MREIHVLSAAAPTTCPMLMVQVAAHAELMIAVGTRAFAMQLAKYGAKRVILLPAANGQAMMNLLGLRRILKRFRPEQICCYDEQTECVLRWMVKNERVLHVDSNSVDRLSDVQGLQHIDLIHEAISRDELRQSWDRDGIPEDAKVIAVLSDHPHRPVLRKASLALQMVCSLVELDRTSPPAPYCLLVHPDVGDFWPAYAMFHKAGVGWRIVQDARLAEPWRVLAGCDAVLVDGPMSLAWAQAYRSEPSVAIPAIDLNQPARDIAARLVDAFHMHAVQL